MYICIINDYIMDFREIWKPPFVVDSDGIFIKASDGVKAFTVAANNPKAEAENIVALLNDNGGEKYKEVLIYGDHKIVTSHASVLITRGFGSLVGITNLSVDDAYKMQDDFIKWVVDKIKE